MTLQLSNLSSFKQILKATSIYTFLGFLPTFSRIFLLPVFLIYLTTADFAIIGLFSMLSSIIPVIITLGMEHAFTRFYFDYQSNKKILNSYFSTVFIFILLVSVIFSVLFLITGNFLFQVLFKNDIFTFYPFGTLALINSVFSAINTLFIVFYRSSKNVKAYSFFNLMLFFLITIFDVLAIVFFRFSLENILILKTAASVIVCLLFSVLHFAKTRISFEKRFIKPSLKYALPVLLYGGLALIFSYLDRIIIENTIDLDALAVFNLAMAIGQVIETMMFAIQTATYPTVYEMFKNDPAANNEGINRLYRLVGVFVILITLIIVSLAPIAIILFLVKEYWMAIPIIPIIVASYYYRYLYIVYAEPIFFFKKTRKLPGLSLMAGLFGFAGNIILIPYLGIKGAAVVFFASKIVILIPTFYWYLKSSTFRFNLRYVIHIVVINTMFCMLLFLLLTFCSIETNWMMMICSVPFILTTIIISIIFIVNARRKNIKSIRSVLEII